MQKNCYYAMFIVMQRVILHYPNSNFSGILYLLKAQYIVFDRNYRMNHYGGADSIVAKIFSDCSFVGSPCEPIVTWGIDD